MALTMSLVEEKTNIDFISEQQTENHAKSLHVFSHPHPNFRNNLISASGFDPGNAAQAHHVFPLKYADFFKSAGINPNSYGAWWGQGHLQNAYRYNQA